MRWGLLVIAASLANASSAPVVSFDGATDFSHYRSYSFVFPHAPANMDPTLYRQITAAIDRSLLARGFVRSRPGNFAVGFTVGPRAKMHASDYGHYAFYYSADEAAAHQKWINSELAGRTEQDDLLSIDIYDTGTKHSIWHGIAPAPLVHETRQSIVEHEVDDVLSMFPPEHR